MDMTVASAQAAKNKTQTMFDKDKTSSAAQAGASFNEVLGRAGAPFNPAMNAAATETAMLQSFNRMVESSRQKMADKSQIGGGKASERDDGPAARPAKAEGRKQVQREERAIRKADDKPKAEKPEARDDKEVSARAEDDGKIERSAEKVERKDDDQDAQPAGQAAADQAPAEKKTAETAGAGLARVQDVTVMVVEETRVEVTVSVESSPEDEFRAQVNRFNAARSGLDFKDDDLKVKVDVEIESSSEMTVMTGEAETADADMLKARNALAKPTLSAQAAAFSDIFEQGGQIQVTVNDNAKLNHNAGQPGHGVSAAALAVSALVGETENLPGENLDQGMMQNPNGQAQAGDGEKAVKGGQAVQANQSAVSDKASPVATFVQAMQAQMEAEGDNGGLGRQVSSVASAQNNGNAAQAAPVGPAGQAGSAQAANSTQQTQAAHAPKLPIPPQKIAEQVSVQIEKAARDGLDKISITLNPEELGRVEVKLEIGRDGRVSASVMVERPETLEALQKEAKNLEKALETAGLKADTGSLSFSLQGNENQQRQAEKEGRSQGQGAFAEAMANGSEGESNADAEIVNLLTARSRAAAARSGVDVNI